MSPHQKGREKVARAAALSVGAATLLTILKLIAGIITGSLGVLSEALHSGLDLIAAGITFLAVRKASALPDYDHQYGHGKIENFAALAETIILWLTSAWIVLEAVRRIQYQEWVEGSVIGISVMVVSIIVTRWQSSMLNRTASEHGSQALEADALHFGADMISSMVVLAGLGFVYLGIPIADPIAAIGVAIVIVVVSFQLGRRAFDILVDSAPQGLRERIEEKALAVDGVHHCKRVRARMSGPELFIDVVLAVDEGHSVSEAKTIGELVERTLEDLAPKVDVVVQLEPIDLPNAILEDNVYSTLQQLARMRSDIKSIHNVSVLVMIEGTHIIADLEMDATLTLNEAHQTSEELEHSIKSSIQSISQVTFHLESAGNETPAHDITAISDEMVQQIERIVELETPAEECHEVRISEDKHGLVVSLECELDGTATLQFSHEVADRIELLVKRAFSRVNEVIVHVEPR
ncbi:MAG: cation-efflux pump [Candidatus Thorarchaeota archaeon]|nr:MAG: cation-efflux pump [Candidatus Thorarchaeota archaeon]